MSKDKWNKTLLIYDQLVDLCPRFIRKGKTMPYTSANGYMFSLLNKDGDLGIRLSIESQKKFVETFDSGPFFSYGAKMRDYVIVPNSLLSDLKLLSKYLDESFDYVMSLPPK